MVQKSRRWGTVLLAMILAYLLLLTVAPASQGQPSDDSGPQPPSGTSGTTSEGQDESARQDSSRVEGTAGRAVERGVSMRPETDGSQAQAVPQRAVEPPPLGLTERGKAALEQARQGNAQPAERRTIDVGAMPSGPSTNGPENNEPQPDTPALGTSFLGVADTGTFPPDSQIAAGPNNIVASTNGAVNILDKRGNSLSSQTLAGFFSPLGAEHNDVFDPWVVYDPYLNRFWLIAVSGRTTALSNIVIGLSDTQDATLGWRLWELDATVDGGTDTQNWCDYPKIGFDAQAIYVTCNMFQLNTTTNRNVFQYSKTRIMTKNQFVNNTGIFWWDTTQLREGNVGTGSFVFTLQPAQMFGASAADGEFLIDAQGGGGTGSTLDVWRITNAAECCNGDNVGPTLAYRSHGVNNYGPSDGARQPGSTTQINNGDSRLLYAFWKNGRLSTGHTVACSGTPTNACGGFTELNVSGYPTISTLRNYAFTAGGQDVYYPAMSVNAADDRTMVFTVSDTSLSPTAAYLGIPSIADCPGNPTCFDGGTTAFRFGQNSNGYVRLDTQGRNRWGDYSGASPDPNGEGIWVAGEFAAATDDTWGVQAGLTYQTSPPPANDPFNGSQFISGTSVSANGTNRYATRQVGEPDHLPLSGSLGEHSVWYSWTAPSSGQVDMNTCTSSFDTTLAVYTGSSFGTMSQVASDDDSCTAPDNEAGSRLTFNAVAGTTYRIAVGGFSSAGEGTFTLQVLDTKPPTVTSTNPANNARGVASGANVRATFSEAMQASTVKTTTFNLKKAGTTTFRSATVTYDPATKTATLNPNNNLQSGATYVATVTTGATDLAGNQLDQDSTTAGNQNKTWKFTVG
jgi:Bacterial Ig-like domain